jgi:hypothetical protein
MITETLPQLTKEQADQIIINFARNLPADHPLKVLIQEGKIG